MVKKIGIFLFEFLSKFIIYIFFVILLMLWQNLLQTKDSPILNIFSLILILITVTISIIKCSNWIESLFSKRFFNNM